MNSVLILKTIEINSSKTIDIILICSNYRNKVIYTYNYEGIHYRLFFCKKEIRNFFNGKLAKYLGFDDDETLDAYLIDHYRLNRQNAKLKFSDVRPFLFPF
jgi:hypothetical protein